MDLYCKLGNELRSMFKDLFDPKMATVTRKKMSQILGLAKKLGDRMEQEARILNEDVEKFLQMPQSLEMQAVMKKHALKLEKETREI